MTSQKAICPNRCGNLSLSPSLALLICLYLQAAERANPAHVTIASLISSRGAVIFHDVDDFIKGHGERAVFLHTGSPIPNSEKVSRKTRPAKGSAPPCILLEAKTM